MGAFAQLVEKYQSLATSVALAASGVPAIAEELAQEAFVTAWYRLPQLRELDKFRSWLCGIVRNHARTARRHARRHAPDAVLLIDDVASDGPTPLDRVIAGQERSIVGDALAALPESYREPLVLFYVERQSIRDIADLLGISEETARQRLSRGRRKLRGDLAALAASRPVRAGVAASVVAAITASLPSPAPAAAIGSAAGKVGVAASTLLALSLAAAVLAVIALGQRTSAAATRSAAPEASGHGSRASGLGPPASGPETAGTPAGRPWAGWPTAGTSAA